MVLQGPGMDISNLSNQRGKGQEKAGGDTVPVHGAGAGLIPPQPAENPALNMKREIRVQQKFQLVHNASTGWVCSQGCGAESLELNMG